MTEKITKIRKPEIPELPKSPGVYLFYDKKGKILYIGKAANIRERVKNHFKTPGFRDNLFLDKIEKIGYKKTDSEIEALLKEAELIKKEQPKFNILWRDDKNYFYLGITKEEFPRVFLTHQLKEQRAKKTNIKSVFIGPFVEGKAIKKTLQFLRKVFPYRTCKTIMKNPCLWYQMRLCPAPCLLSSKVASQISNFREKIKKESQENARSLLKIFQGKKKEVLKNLKKEMEKFSKAQEFEKAANRRDQIKLLENILEHARVIQIINERKNESWQEIEKELRKVLGVRRKIKRIEGYDISNIQGQTATGSMIVFKEGKSDKSEYRKFKIKIDGKPDDVAMLREVISRRFKHREWSFPELILIDGGKAQLNAALSVTRNYYLSRNKKLRTKKIALVALAKKDNKLYLENRKEPILLKNISQEISNLLLRIRDKAHRFAITYHRNLRKKRLIN